MLQTMIDIFHSLADSHEEEPGTIHMGLGGPLFLEVDLLESSVEALMKGMKRETEGLIPITTTLEKDLRHLESQGVIK